MSAPLAGKFIDHYEVLGIESNADARAIKEAYTKLVAKYSPSNPRTGDKEKFDELNASYEILTDVELKRAFDAVRGGGNEDAAIVFPVQEFLGDLDADAGRRICLLALLYYRRKYRAISPGISLRQVESVMQVTSEELAFITWVLKQRGLATSDDKSRLLVTVAGIDFVEKMKPTAEHILPWLRPEAIGTGPADSSQEAPEPETQAPAAALIVNGMVKGAPTLPDSNPAGQPMPQREAVADKDGPGLTTAGLSSLRTALHRSLGMPPGAANAPAKQQPAKTQPAGKR